jgi:Predicted membrane protein (DUF2339)
MEGIVILLVLFVLWLFIAPIVAMVKAGDAKAESQRTRDDLQNALLRIKALEKETQRLKNGFAEPPDAIVLPERRKMENASEPHKDQALNEVLERVKSEELRIKTAEKISTPPPLPEPASRKKLVDWGEDGPPPKVPAPPLPAEPSEPFSLEKFMGVKLFAWLGGVAMFFGVIFFVKYAFENNLISPATRITLGFVTGAGLLAGGLLTHRLPKYRVLAQAFCATGVLILYGVSFAAHAVYHFPAFDTLRTFALMAGITFAAFLIAVRLNALVVAVLGMLGGFVTPVLLSTGQDQVLGLFGYIALLDIGLLAVSRHRRWRFLTPWAAVGTAILQIGWFQKFFNRGGYDEGNLTLVPMGILLGFIALFLIGGWIRRRRPDTRTAGAVLGLATVAVLFSFAMLAHGSVAERPFLLYGFLLLVHLGAIATVIARPALGIAQVIAALLGFLHLACWTTWYLDGGNLHATLAIYLIFGALHAVVPLVVSRRMKGNTPAAPLKSGVWAGPIVLGMMLLPILLIEPVPMIIWVAILMANLLVIAVAAATRAVAPVIVSLALTMAVAAVWLFQTPAAGNAQAPFLGVVTGFSALFAAAGRWCFRGGDGKPSSLAALSGVLPFALILVALHRLPVPDPSAMFGVVLLMTALLATLAITGKQGKLLYVALLGTIAVEGVWYALHFDKGAPGIPLAWFVGFHALFLILPFATCKRCADLSEAWIASALSGVAHFPLVHLLVKQAWPNDFMGLVPAAFAVPSLLGLFGVWKLFQGMDARQQSRLAWFGGVALLFITLIFPIQFERQWITVSWAIEGALLLWLFRRVPHPGLQLTGLALLAISFVRLSLNPAVFTDYERSGTAILNWHLYAYGLVAAAHFAGAKWFTDPKGKLKEIKPCGVLLAMGGILLFLLLNIEIADYFTAPGDRYVAFRFGGNFARDMTYSIAWGLFSLCLLGIGFWSRSKHARFAAVGLLVVTLVKVFLHDLAAIQNIFRIGALVGVAIIAFIASFLYQRFFDRPEK